MWVVISLICAMSLALSDGVAKEALRRGADDLAVGWLRLVFSLPVMAVILFVIEWPPLDRAFYIAAAVTVPFEFAAYYLYNKALQVSPMGLSMPFQSLTPVFLIVVGYLITGESVTSISGISGIGLIAVGGYMLNINTVRGEGFMGPLRAIGRERGALMMIGVAAIYSVTASVSKVAVMHSGALFFGAVYYFAMTIVYAPLGVSGLGRSGRPDRGVLRLLLLSGLLMGVTCITGMLAISMTKVAYVIAVKRTSLLMSVALGYWMFKEEHLRDRMLGASLMLGGFLLVVFAGG